MSQFEPAAEITLKNEGGFYHNTTTGEIVNMGVTLTTLRSLKILKTTGPPSQSDIDFVKSLTEDEAKDIYKLEYWDNLNLDAIDSQPIANKLFDLAVNMGVVTAARILQEACAVAIDGIVGPLTIDRANHANPTALLASIKQIAKQRYILIAQNNPALTPDLSGWLTRLNT